MSGNMDIGLVGLGVMGENLVMNMNDKGFSVAVYNRTVEKVTKFVEGTAKGTKVQGALSLKDLVGKLAKPRRIILLVKAGEAVDGMIAQIAPLLEKGDIIIDGGNSNYKDSQRRSEELEGKGLLFVGMGVSGGEEGARHGPSLMPGGSPAAWPSLKDILQKTAAQVDGQPCCDWVGKGGSGHFVKTVHNGVEYGDMQLIAEAYSLLKAVGLGQDEIAKAFREWNKTELDSYLIEITADILAFKDTDGAYLLPKIRDAAGQKGTGKWTAIEALDLGQPVTLVSEAVYARCLSALKEERVKASGELGAPAVDLKAVVPDTQAFVESVRKALYAAKMVSYCQGFMLLAAASKENKWELNFGAIALMWRGGCIIRSVFLGKIKEAFEKDADLSNLLLDPFFKGEMTKNAGALAEVVSKKALLRVPTPAMSSALDFFDGYRSAVLPANLLQAQRDYFGAHMFERLGGEGKWEHANWTGKGGTTTSSAYNA